MVNRLKSAFQNQQSLLVLRVALYGFSLLFVSLFGGGLWRSTGFFIVALLVYFNPSFNSGKFLASFIVLVFTSFVALASLTGTSVWIGVAASSILFYIILALKDLAFVNRDWWHSLLHLSLFYMLSALFFYGYSNHPNGYLITLFIILLFLFNERFKNNFPLSAVLTLIVVEGAWAVGLLPLGFLNSAGALLLLFFVVSDIAFSATLNKLTPRLVLSNVTISILALLFLFISTSWRI
jgi:hypothetical protein